MATTKQQTQPKNQQAVEGSFSLDLDFTINAPPARVFQAIVHEVNVWWTYRLADRPSMMILEPHVGGRLYEDWGAGLGAMWGVVMAFDGERMIRLQGPLGMTMPVTSVYTMTLNPGEDGTTTLHLAHQCAGLIRENWGQAHREGWTELLGSHLKNWVERGTPPQG